MGELSEKGLNQKKFDDYPEFRDVWRSKEIKAVWENPESGEKKDISFDIDKEIKYFKNFYESKLGIGINEKEVRRIWETKGEKVKKGIETLGYDTLLIIPDRLPDLETIDSKLIETMADDETWISQNLLSRRADMPFQMVLDTERNKTKIILTKGNQNIRESGDPLLEATLNKDIMQTSGLKEEVVEDRIDKRQPLPVDFETTINNKKIKVQAEGFNLREYMVFQRVNYDKHQKHLDEKGTTRLLNSMTGGKHSFDTRVVEAAWNPRTNRLNVDSRSPDTSVETIGTRFLSSYS